MNKQVKTFIITFLIALPVFFFSFKYFNGDFDDDPAPVSGCIDELAYNYNKEATVDGGSCIDIVKGCIDRHLI